MQILISGSTGFIGSSLVRFLTDEGHNITRLVRRDSNAAEPQVRWDPQTGTIDSKALAEIEGVVHLAGESAVGRWTARKKTRVLESRSNGTRLLSETLAGLETPPAVMVCASGQDFYGDRGEEVLSEDSGPGSGFLADVTARWEAATRPAADAGIRVVNTRSGMVLGAGGGVLGRMLPAFKLGLGGRFGSGRQYASWVSLTDSLRIFQHCLTTESITGPTNVAAPNPVTNAEFARTLARVLARPSVFPVPAIGLRLIFGEMAGMMLGGARLDSSKLVNSGFEFQHPQLEGALRAELGKPP